MSAIFTPYSTVAPFIRGMPTWVPEDDQQRIASYQTYEEIYWNNPAAFELIRRGAEDFPIYIPNARTIVDTTAHFILKGLSINFEDPEANAEATLALQAFLRRERFYSKFNIAKHSGVVRGDFLLHLTADPDKPEGRRISLNSVDPASYFPVADDDDLDRITKVHLVEQFENDEEEVVVRKLTYWYEGEGDARTVWRSEAIFELDEWAEPDVSPMEVTLPPAALPPELTTIPVYHFQNIGWQGQPFGSSELRGFERLLGAVNQSISDEELALALVGLGVYATDADSPTDESGNEVPWQIAPAKVIEHEVGRNFKRVEGISSVAPMRDHIKYLEEKLFEASGTSEVARGSVDVGVAESGIALAIRFVPMAAKIEMRDQTGLDVLTQFFFDWKSWHKAYEGPDFLELPITPVIGEKLPINRKAIVEELNSMLERKVISRAFYRQRMTELFGYTFPDEMENDIIAEEARLTEALDMMGSRISRELGE
jgi:hypothetical protein